MSKYLRGGAVLDRMYAEISMLWIIARSALQQVNILKQRIYSCVTNFIVFGSIRLHKVRNLH